MVNSNSNSFSFQDLIYDIKETISVTMDLENLKQQYDNLLSSYQQAVSNYINYLNYASTNKNYNPYSSMKGYAYNGTGTAGESKATTLENCTYACSTSPLCSGATFVSNQCLLRSGESPIVPSSYDSYAIVPEGVKLLFNIENINQQLINVNQQITSIMDNSNSLYDSQVEDRTDQQQTLLQNYKELSLERDKILSLLKDYETLDNTISNDDITIKSSYYTYILLLLIVIASGFILYKLSYSSSNTSITIPAIQYGGDLGMNSYLIVFIITIITLLFIKYFK